MIAYMFDDTDNLHTNNQVPAPLFGIAYPTTSVDCLIGHLKMQ